MARKSGSSTRDNIRRVILYLYRKLPKHRDLKGTFLHRTFGERLFDKNIWKPSQRGVALGFALGTFIALTPTVGVQMILAAAAAIYWRANVPVAIAACWITNPISMMPIYHLQYKLGLILSGFPVNEIGAVPPGKIKAAMEYMKPLWIGSLFSSTFISLLIYLLTIGIWRSVAGLFHLGDKPAKKHKRKKN
jgi:uncharacterized protein